jgi:DeoR/GlpR family transcriptional regulator of sugar metabolism
MKRTLIPAQRRERIQEYLTVHKIARCTDLSDLLSVSEATVRRDLEWLETSGFLERTHGGAMLSEQVDLEAEYRQRAQRFPLEKRLIGAAAAALVEDGDTVFINSGTTTTQLIKHLRPNGEFTVITNNLIAALEVGEVGYEILLLGGTFQPKSNSVAGRFAAKNLSQVYANKTFIGVDGISLKYGCTVPANGEAELVRLMFERTHGPVTVLADHSKWGVVSNYEVATIDHVQRLVSDDGLDPGAQASLAARNVEIVVASSTLVKVG